MRAFRLGLAALALSAVLSACGAQSGALAPLNTTPAEAEAYIARLTTESIKGKATAAADIAAVRDALPKEVSLTWGSLTFDAASGATVLTDVKIAPTDMPTVGLRIAEVRLWDFDADFAKARLTGQRLTETANLARRIEAKTLSVFGLETLVAPMTEAGIAIGEGITEPLIDPLVGGDPALAEQLREQMRAQSEMSIDSYEISIASFVLDDVMLRPFEIRSVQLPPENDFAEAMPFLQTYAAAWRAVAFDTMAAKGATLKYAMTQMGQRISFSMSADTYGIRGFRGGDMDVSVIRGGKMEGSIPNPTNPDGAPMSFAMGADLMAMEGTRLDKLYGYLARGEWPPRSDTNLMSYGRMIVQKVGMSINNTEFMTIGELVADLRDFHWFIPTKVRLSANDFAFDFGAMASLQEVMSPSPPPTEIGDPLEFEGATTIDPQVLEVLKRYGLDKASFDTAFGWDWNPNSGAATIDGAFGLDRYMRFDAKFSGTTPNFKSVSDLIPGGFETADGEAIGQLFQNLSNLKLIELNVVDEGGLDKGFALAVEIGKMMPIEPGQPDFFANQTPESLRQIAVAGVYLLRDQAAAQLPALRDLLNPFGAFVEKGGNVRVTFKPRKPLDASALEAMGTGAADPAALLNDVKVEHTPAPGGPLKPN